MESRGGKPPTIINPHHRFFSSLKHLEHRLSSEPNATTNTDGNPINTDFSPSASNLSSPLFLAGGLHPPTTTTTTTSTASSSSSLPPPEFLLSHPSAAADEDDDAERLMGILGLSPGDTGGEEGGGEECSRCCSGDGFYRRVAGVKGPKGEGERRRLERWIRHHRVASGEPARLAYLLLGKAASSWDVDFPAAIEGHLGCDPPGAGDAS